MPHRVLFAYPERCLGPACPIVGRVERDRRYISALEAQVKQLVAYAEAASAFLDAVKEAGSVMPSEPPRLRIVSAGPVPADDAGVGAHQHITFEVG